jgi:hypothetical protein
MYSISMTSRPAEILHQAYDSQTTIHEIRIPEDQGCTTLVQAPEALLKGLGQLEDGSAL